MKTLLLTGGCGFIGSHLARFVLRNRDWRITILDRLDSAGAQSRIADLFRDYPDRVALVHHDLRAAVSDAVSIEIMTGGHKWPLARFDYVAHLAAGSHVERSVQSPVDFVLDNVLGTANLLDFIRMHAAVNDDGRTLTFQTDEIFGSAPDGVAFRPWDRFNALNPYAATKAGSDALATAYAHTYSMPIVTTRCGNAMGPDQHPEKFVPIAIKKILAGESVPVHAVDGVPCSRLYIYVENIASATVHILERGDLLDGSERRGKYNITASEEVSNVDLVKNIGEILGIEAKYHLVENPPGRLKPDLRYSISGDELAAIGWLPTIPLRAGLQKTVESFARKEALAVNNSTNGCAAEAKPLGDIHKSGAVAPQL